MKLNFKYITLGVLLCVTLTNAQDKREQKVADIFEDYAYADAIESYQELIKKGYTSEEIYKNLGNANYFNANYEAASSWYEKLFLLEGATQYTDELFRYAQSLKSQENYEASDKWMEILKGQQSKDYRALKFEDKLDYLTRIKNVSGRYDIKTININSKQADYAPAFFGNTLVFSSVRDTGLTQRNINQWNNKPFSDLYSAPLSENGDYDRPYSLSKELNTKAHESSAVFTKDGQTVYFTRNNDANGKFSRDDQGVSRLKLYRATLVNESWTNVVELPFNQKGYSTAHPTLSEDERTLYFSSDIPGTLGESDIFSVTINEDGSYGTPSNLGPDINTESRETFPFIHKNILYFASDGHPGLGGLDVFASDLEAKANKQVLNVGKPINGEQDDFAYIINDNGEGFFTSNREGGVGDDDIYSFKENENLSFACIGTMRGKVIDKETGNILPNAKVTIQSASGEIVFNSISDSKGNFESDLACSDEEYTIKAMLDGYDTNTIPVAMLDNKDAEIEVPLPKTKLAKNGEDLIAFLGLAPINFDLDKASIREDASKTLDKAIGYLIKNPSIKLAIESHTDAKATKKYNQKLSEKRANSTYKYLISKGIAESRIQFKGYGENRLVNDCTVWDNCSPEKNEENRRSELIVVE